MRASKILLNVSKRAALPAARTFSTLRVAPVAFTKARAIGGFHYRPFATANFFEKVPPLGDSISEGSIVEWVKKVGNYVDADEVLCVLETDKVSVDIRATKSGEVVIQCAKEGDALSVGADLAGLDTTAAKPAGGAPKEAPKAAAAAAPAAATATAAAPKADAPKAAPAPAKAAPTPVAAPAVVPGSRGERRVPATRMRLTIANRLKESQNTAAMLTTFNEIDMTNIMALREKTKDEFQEVHGVKLGFMSAFVAASTNALKKFPDVNAYLDGKEIIYRDYVDVSVAVATPTGLVVPVLRNTENMSFAQIEGNIAALGEKAKKNQITLEDMTGGSFTISNGGVFGSLMGTPIINLPQSAILGMHGIFKRPVAIGNNVEIRPMMYIALTYDHRLIDGSTAVRFLKTVKNGVEEPSRLLLGL